jgi:hypothetical protein
MKWSLKPLRNAASQVPMSSDAQMQRANATSVKMRLQWKDMESRPKADPNMK